MAHKNRYYIINASDKNINEIYKIIVGGPGTQRHSINGEKIVIKLHLNDHNTYDFLSNYQEYNHGEILYIMSGPEWTQEIPQ
jgi:hypothetical protein